MDRYLYLTALAGVREPEPLFGPLSWDDYRRKPHSPEMVDKPLGFKTREGTSWVKQVNGKSWRLYVNGRQKESLAQFEKVRERLTGALAAILEEPRNPNVPLYPDLWFKEQLAREALRKKFQELQTGTVIQEVAKRLAKALEEKFTHWSPRDTTISVGIYLDTGDDWKLCGGEHLWNWLPEAVPRLKEEGEGDLNAFNWVGRSTRSLLLRHPLSAAWARRIQAGGDDLANIVGDPDFSGMCIVPILHPQRQWCLGIILMIVKGPEAQSTPAHVYLLSRLALGVSGYLALLLPIPGFPWWPDARLERGGANIERMPHRSLIPPQLSEKMLRRIAEDLMPTDSTVEIDTLRAGHSGAPVFRLSVKGEGGIREIPRVLKVGDAKIIANELWRYYRYVHNKQVGGASRIDVARGFPWPPHTGGYQAERSKEYGAIVYTFVGAGEEAVPWSQWVKTATEEELTTGLTMLKNQLSCWMERRKGAGRSIINLMLKPLAEGARPLQNYLDSSYPVAPGFDEVKELIVELSRLNQGELKDSVSTCIVHDDLHSDNIFAVLSSVGRIQTVALIDWGNVKSKRHLLSDISKLMTDLAYRIVPTAKMREMAFRTVREWGSARGCNSEEWKVAMIHQIAKMMFYRDGSDRFKPYVENSVRLQAWEDLKNLAADLTEKAASHSAG
ncbi:MAG TPA: hypothetical protein VGC87_01295 [Pyrinomonadaceae bacterium]